MPPDPITPGVSLASVVLHLRCLQTDLRQRSLGHAADWVLLNALGLFESPMQPAEGEQINRKEDLQKSGGPQKPDTSDKTEMKPYTASVLFEADTQRLREARRFSVDALYCLRYTALNADIAVALNRALTSGDLREGSQVELDKIPFQIEAIATHREHHPLAGQTDYGALAWPAWGGQARLSSKITLEFFSPIFFRKRRSEQADQGEPEENGKDLYVPMPVPDMLFGNLAEHWNLYAPLRLPDGYRQAFAEQVVFSSYNLRTAVTPYKEGSLKIGALGVATYEAPRSGWQMRGMLNLLADFALYAGAGMMTAQGFGQLRRLDES